MGTAGHRFPACCKNAHGCGSYSFRSGLPLGPTQGLCVSHVLDICSEAQGRAKQSVCGLSPFFLCSQSQFPGSCIGKFSQPQALSQSAAQLAHSPRCGQEAEDGGPTWVTWLQCRLPEPRRKARGSLLYQPGRLRMSGEAGRATAQDWEWLSSRDHVSAALATGNQQHGKEQPGWKPRKERAVSRDLQSSKRRWTSCPGANYCVSGPYTHDQHLGLSLSPRGW